MVAGAFRVRFPNTSRINFKYSIMKQSEFLSRLRRNFDWQRNLQKALNRHGDGGFYFCLGSIFGDLGIDGWESEAFIDKVCKICDIEF